MGKKVLYQTLENQENPDYVEKNGPFPCTSKYAWLGPGFYFWEYFIDNAHWWGNTVYPGNYFICKASCEFSTETCFDLVGEPKHSEDFDNCLNYLVEHKILVLREVTVAKVLQYMKKYVTTFNYKAVRVYGINSVSAKDSRRINFIIPDPQHPKSLQYLDMRPAIQLCLFEKRSLSLNDFHIVYPPKYCSEGTI